MFNIQPQSAITNESTMEIKHASACVVQNFLSSLFFLLNKWPLKVSRKYICQDFDTIGENKFCIVQIMSMVVKTIMILHVWPLTSWKCHALWLIVPTPHATQLKSTIDFYCMHTILAKCSQRVTSMPPVQSALQDFGKSFCKGIIYRDDRTTDKWTPL
jgi:hypothetical protein